MVSREPEGRELEVRVVARVRGRVQGVGFRWWTRTQAEQLGLAGWARNLADGRVEVVAEGPRPRCDRLLEWLAGSDTPGRVEEVSAEVLPAAGNLEGFVTR
ncbi:MAG: acylphosphatase [Micromonosporaceae bacterium]